MTVEPDDKGGLGYISKAGELAVTLELEPPVTSQLGQMGGLSLSDSATSAASGFGGMSTDSTTTCSTATGSTAMGGTPRAGPSGGTTSGRKKRTPRTRTRKGHAPAATTLQLLIHQDPSGLHSRSGETGTVLWRSSLALAEHTLATLVFEPPGWLSWPDVSVLELGSGVGLLAATLGSVTRSWTATDYLMENLRLVKRNCVDNADIRAEIAHLVRRSPAADHALEEDEDNKGKKGRRRTTTAERNGSVKEVEMPTLTQLDWTTVSAQRVKGQAEVPKCDLVLAVDCLYNEHLVRPLVDTLAMACLAGAVAFVVVELRSSDVVSH